VLTTQRIAASAPGDPASIGPYAVLGRLGAGGMGTVHLGRAPDGRLVAIKVLRRELAADPRFVARFADEMQAARRVAPFCTAPVLDAAPNAVPPWLVTEYVEGVPLDEAVRSGGPLSGSTLDGVAVGIATALTAIHAAGLVHRDLKPANVLLSATGPRVIDFGIARAMDATSGHTAAGMLLGSPGWLAPEILAGQPVSPAADVFAWGLLVAYAATGSHPFGVGSDQQAYAALHGSPQLAGIPQPLVQHVAAALSRDPWQRPSAQALLLALLGPANGDPARAATQALRRTWDPPTRILTGVLAPHPPRRRRWWRRPRVLIPLALVAGLIVLLGAWDDRQSQQPQQPSGDAGTAAAPAVVEPAPTSGPGVPVRDGQLEFVVQSVQCGVPEIGRTGWLRTADGAYCLIPVEVRNIGRESRQLNEWQVALHDSQGERHHADVSARWFVEQGNLWESVDPGASVQGTMVFDIPAGTEPVRLEFHDTLLSSGVELEL
jgi:eukaryotic-like serine/threonine-protein kinase